MSHSDISLSRLPSARPRFFTRVDWASFWTATLVSFAVYAFTAAPSVTLEDAGELVTAGDHLGVPHPPGYPIWTVCAFLFARVLSFVKFMGQPNPAWAISIMSGFFGAVAAGLTAMLITRSAADMLSDFDKTDDAQADASRHALLSWAGGVAGSLVFAFSPVEWSQSTIPEVYTLNALFLMWVFLLSYRWMRQPSDRLLWAVAFIFGLGLTNYQMLLFAIVPLVIIILLRDIGLFRDFALTALPFLMTAGILMLGAKTSQPGFMKNAPYKTYEAFLGPPLAAPSLYAVLVLLMAIVIGAAIVAGIRRRRAADARTAPAPEFAPELFVAIGAGVLLLLVCLAFPTAPSLPPGITYVSPEKMFHWGKPVVVFLGLLAALWAFAWATPGGRWYAAAVTAIELPLAILLRKGCLLGLTHPLTGWFAFYVAINFAVLALAWALLPRGKSVAVAFLCAEAGVAFYGYMPISSETNPPMNWGYPRTWEGFKHAITRGQYEKLVPTNPFDPIVVDQLGGYFADLRKQFTLLLVPLGFLPFTLWRLRVGRAETPESPKFEVKSPKSENSKSQISNSESEIAGNLAPANLQTCEPTNRQSSRGAFDCFTIAFALAALVAVFAAADRLLDKASAFVPHQLYIASLGAILLAVAIGFAAVAIRQFQSLLDIVLDRSRPFSERVAAGLSLAAAALVLIVMVAGMCRAVAAYRVVGVDAVPDSVSGAGVKIAAVTVALALFAAAAFVAIAYLASRGGGRRLALKIDDTAQQWFVALFACFLVMSFLVIVMAAPKGDLQDNFIQKVKFISSHAIFSLWIGYGLVFGLALVASLERRLRAGSSAAPRRAASPLAAAAAVAVLVAAPLVPIYENYCNDGLIEEMSSASQDGHDFGWQFGNYQLRGAEAIAEELRDDEEPLPNPDYPAAMTTNAVFYGGTDPGRFVPTYMIFSADVRPDVFLITQNALADNTYMDTMRDMYGDQIWMPTPRDNANSFEQYIEDVNAGRRPNYGGITSEGGRMQVNGALAVMEINGILSELIFQKNRDRHDFYVEESYAMRWMNPYATPHGLILKVEHDPCQIPQRRVRADLDFWDWYSRRLLATPKYKRDFTARKSFSKLRSAIAGIYAVRHLDSVAERAFREAVRLYPASPESNTRLVQEILVPQGRFAESLRLLRSLQAADPNNRRLPDFIGQITRLDAAKQTIASFSDLAAPSPADFLALAEAHHVLFQREKSVAAARKALEKIAAFPVPDRFRLALVLHDGGDDENAARAVLAIPAEELPVLAETAGIRSVFAILANAGQFTPARNLLVRHLRDPQFANDWRSWIDLGHLDLAAGRQREAAVSIDKARRLVIASADGNLDKAAADFMGEISLYPDLKQFFDKLYPQRSPGTAPQTPVKSPSGKP